MNRAELLADDQVVEGVVTEAEEPNVVPRREPVVGFRGPEDNVGPHKVVERTSGDRAGVVRGVHDR